MASCPESPFELIMYFTVNLTFVNYFDNWTNSIDTPALLHQTTYEQILFISLTDVSLKSDLLKVKKY